jgi:tetratricopeptide (TPR) repeat protein
LTAGQIERLVITVPPDAPSIAASKIESTQALQRQLRGDLDGVVLRCLRKAANERYASVEQLDADLGNYLEGRPVLARGGHGWYRARKFVLRNKFAVGASIFIAAMLTTGIAIIARQSKIARLQAQIAEQRAAELEKVVKFQVGMLAQVDPGIAGQSLSNDVHAMLQKALDRAGASEAERSELTSSFSKAWESISTTDAARNLIDTTVLKPATAEIDRQFSGQPLVDAALRQSLADLYRHLGLLDAAFPLQKQALKVRRQMLLPGTPELSDSLSSMGLLLHERGDLVAAEEHLREALQERRSSLGNNNPNTLDSAHQLGEVLVSQGKQSDAESLFREALEGRRHILGETHPETLTSMIRLGAIYMDVGRPADAEPYVREAYEKASSSLEENHQFRIFAAFRMGALMRLLGRLPEAEVFAREATERRRKLLGQDHQDTMRSTDLLSIVLQEQGKLAEAEPFSLAVLNTRRKILGEEHLDTASATINMASLLRRQNKLAEAEPLFRKASAIFSPKPGTDPFFTNVSIYKLGDVLQAQGKHAEAITILAPAEDQMREVFTGNHASRLATFLMALGRARTGLKQFAIAESNLLESNTIYGLTPGPYPKDRRDSVQALVELYGAWHAKEPDKGYDVLASKWKKELEETQSTDP